VVTAMQPQVDHVPSSTPWVDVHLLLGSTDDPGRLAFAVVVGMTSRTTVDKVWIGTDSMTGGIYQRQTRPLGPGATAFAEGLASGPLLQQLVDGVRPVPRLQETTGWAANPIR
jgi:hypothetical protein